MIMFQNVSPARVMYAHGPLFSVLQLHDAKSPELFPILTLFAYQLAFIQCVVYLFWSLANG